MIAYLSVSGSGANSKSKEAIKIAFDYFKANISRVSSLSKVGDHDYHLHIVEMNNTGAVTALTLSQVRQKFIQTPKIWPNFNIKPLILLTSNSKNQL